MTPGKFFDQPCTRCGVLQSVVNGLWLRQQRERAGLSLREFARRAGVSPAYICDIEHHRRACLPNMRKHYEALR